MRDLGTADVDARLEELLIDGILYAFQEQVWLRARQPAQQAAPLLSLLLKTVEDGAVSMLFACERPTCTQMAPQQRLGMAEHYWVQPGLILIVHA